MKFLNFNSLVLVMLVCMAGTFFASCGVDDDNNDDITNNGGGGSDDEDFNTTSLIVGSWKTTWNSYGNGGVVISNNYEILTFNSDGTGSDYYYEMGSVGNDPIRYMYDSDKRTLTIFNERNGDKDIYKVKSISRTKLVIELNINNAEEEIYYRI